MKWEEGGSESRQPECIPSGFVAGLAADGCAESSGRQQRDEE